MHEKRHQQRLDEIRIDFINKKRYKKMKRKPRTITKPMKKDKNIGTQTCHNCGYEFVNMKLNIPAIRKCPNCQTFNQFPVKKNTLHVFTEEKHKRGTNLIPVASTTMGLEMYKFGMKRLMRMIPNLKENECAIAIDLTEKMEYTLKDRWNNLHYHNSKPISEARIEDKTKKLTIDPIYQKRLEAQERNAYGECAMEGCGNQYNNKEPKIEKHFGYRICDECFEMQRMDRVWVEQGACTIKKVSGKRKTKRAIRNKGTTGMDETYIDNRTD